MDRRAALTSIAAALGAVSLTRPQAAAQGLETVNVGKLSGISDSPFILADAKGFFREAGVNVNWTTFPQSQAMVAPLASGQLDALGASVSAGIYNAIGRGLPIRIVGDRGIDTPGYGALPLMVRTDLVKSGRFKRLADLKGMKIAEPGKGSSNLPILVRFLEKAGLSYDQIEHQYIPFPDQIATLRGGSTDATVLIEPYANEALNEGIAVRIAPDDSVYPNHQISALMYSTQFVQKRPDVARRFFVGYLRGIRYYHDALKGGKFAGGTADDVIAILQQNLKIPAAANWRAMTPSSVNPDGHVNVPSLQYDYDVYKKLGLIADPTSVIGAIDMSFANAAYKTLGAYKPR